MAGRTNRTGRNAAGERESEIAAAPAKSLEAEPLQSAPPDSALTESAGLDAETASDGGVRGLRVLSVLEAIAGHEGLLSVADLTCQLGLPKATVYRLCAVLERGGYLQRELGGRRLVLGPRSARLGYAVLSGGVGRGRRRLLLRRLASKVGETCNIAVPDGDAMIYFDRVETDWPMRIQLPVGSRVPLHATASGKLYLATLPADQRDRLLSVLDLEPRAANTITDKAALADALAAIAECGIGTDNEELLDAMVAVAVPIRNRNGRLVAALAMHGPTMRLSMADALARVPDLRETASRLEDAIRAV